MSSDYKIQQQAVINQLKASIQQGERKTSIVRLRNDYDNDDEISLTTVIFLPPAVSDRVQAAIIEPLKRIEPNHFYYSNQHLHFTIKNVRQMHNPPRFNQEDIENVNRLFAQLIPPLPSFNFTLEGTMLFPTSVAVLAYSSQAFGELVQALDRGLTEIGLPDDKTYISNTIFFGNMTVCRLTHQPSQKFLQQVNELESIAIGEVTVRNIHLVTCNCVCSPKTRQIIATYSLDEAT